MPKFLLELAQLFYGDTPMFGLKALSMLFAQVFDDSEIRAAFGAIKAFADFRQWETAGLAGLSNGNHGGMTGWSKVHTESRTERGPGDGRRLWRTAIIGQEAVGAVEIGQGRGGTERVAEPQ
jgi:hypothetical protein